MLGLAAMLLAVFGAGGFFDGDPRHRFAATGPRAGISALYFSGDMGLRFGMGPATAHALAGRGVPVLGLNSSTLFRTHRTRDEAVAIVADAVRQAVDQGGRDRLVLIGQSFGADVLQTGLASLPADLRPHVGAVVLVVPGRDVFFRADPTGFAYRGPPDSNGADTIRRLGWVPLTCIYGAAERDSACPALLGSGATVIAMPGGHFLGRDSAGLIAHVLAAIGRIARPLRS